MGESAYSCSENRTVKTKSGENLRDESCLCHHCTGQSLSSHLTQVLPAISWWHLWPRGTLSGQRHPPPPSLRSAFYLQFNLSCPSIFPDPVNGSSLLFMRSFWPPSSLTSLSLLPDPIFQPSLQHHLQDSSRLWQVLTSNIATSTFKPLPDAPTGQGRESHLPPPRPPDSPFQHESERALTILSRVCHCAQRAPHPG